MAIQNIVKILERQTLNTKLLLVLGFVYLITVAVGVQSIFITQTLKSSTQKSYEIDLLGVSHIQKAQLNLVGIGRCLRQMAMTSNPTEREAARKALETAQLGVKSELAEVQERLILAVEKDKLVVFNELFLTFSDSVNRIVALLNNGELYSDGEAIDLIVSAEFNSALSAAENALSEISNFKQEDVKKSNEINEKKADDIQRFTLQMLVFGFVGSVGIGWLISNSIRHPFGELSDSVGNLAQGKLDIVIPHAEYQNEVGNMANSLKVLQHVAQTLDEERWRKKHEIELLSQLQQANNLTTLSQNFFSTVCPLLKACYGLLYVNQDGVMQLRGSYGHVDSDSDNLKSQVKFGEGLIGQCATEKTKITLSAPADDSIKIRLGFGILTPKFMSILPIVHANQLEGVLELAFFESLDIREIKLLEGLLPIFATSIHILQRTSKLDTHLNS